MDPLVKAALVGSAAFGREVESEDPTAREVLAALCDEPLERRILLAAGARALARGAGFVPRSLPEPAAAPARGERPMVSARLASALSDMFERHDDLLEEALVRIAARGLELAPELLPRALATHDDGLRRVLRPVLGPGASWLAQYEASFRWAVDVGASLEDLRRAFEEGTTDERARALEGARRIDAAVARSWVEGAFAVEKADVRARFVAVLEEGLSMDDEPFLERTLDDRGREVREEAQLLLARLGSPDEGGVLGREARFVARMRARGDVAWPTPGTLTPPSEVAPGDVRDGLLAKPPSKTPRAYWLCRIVSAIPPAHWTERFALGPAELVSAVRASDWAEPLLHALAEAATNANDVAWLDVLAHDLRVRPTPGVPENESGELYVDVLAALPRERRIAQVAALVAHPNAAIAIADALETVDAPWPPSLAKAWAREIVKHGDAGFHDPWVATLPVAARRVPGGLVDATRELVLGVADVPAWKRSAEDAFEVLRLRAIVHEEVGL